MLTKEFKLFNLKCSGCENQIKTKVNNIKGVASIKIDIGTSLAIMEYDTEATFNKVKGTLSEMGYPINEEDNSTFKKAKSYVSCMIGRITKEEE